MEVEGAPPWQQGSRAESTASNKKKYRVVCEYSAKRSVKPVKLPARSPNLNCHAERWVRSVKDECLSKLILFGESSLRRALTAYVAHFHRERNHQGKDNLLLFPDDEASAP